MNGIYISGNIAVLIILSICIYIVISNNKKQRQLFEYAYIDPITKKGNIYYLRKKGQEIIEKRKPKEIELKQYIVVLDINKFKLINKAYGYKVGDIILKGIAEEIENLLGKESLICRLSNDYFAALFEFKENIHYLLEEMVRHIENLKVGDNVYIITVTAEDNTTKEYKITITREEEKVNYSGLEENQANNYWDIYMGLIIIFIILIIVILVIRKKRGKNE